MSTNGESFRLPDRWDPTMDNTDEVHWIDSNYGLSDTQQWAIIIDEDTGKLMLEGLEKVEPDAKG